MARYMGSFAFLFLAWMQRMANAQEAYDPQSASPTVISTPYLNTFSYLVLIGFAGVIVFLIYKYYVMRNERTDHGQIETLSKMQPAQRQSSISTAAKLVPGSVFISYRRDDSADITGRIYDRLIQYFSREIVFKDVDSIPLGIDFRQHLEGALSQCRVLLAILGDQWMGTETGKGKRRIDDPRDHVRLELELALSRNIPVIPVLVRKAAIPSEDALPPSLRSLAYRNGIQVRPDPDFHGDIDRLIKGIETHLSRSPQT